MENSNKKTLFEIYATELALADVKAATPPVIKMLNKIKSIIDGVIPSAENRDTEFYSYSSYKCPLCIEIKWSVSCDSPHIILLHHKEHAGVAFITLPEFEQSLLTATRVDIV